jgi:sugar phosphate isomerase/epimerase
MPTVHIETAIQHVAHLGFDGLELTVTPGYTTELSTLDAAERKRIAALLRRHNLALPAIAAHSSLLAMEADVHAQNIARLKGAIDLALDLAQGDSLPVVETLSGGQPDDWATRKQLLVGRVGDLVGYAASRGVTLALEPHIGMAVDTPTKMLELLDGVGSPYFKVNFDISHFDVLGLAIEESIAALVPYSVHAHVKDQRGRTPDFEFLIPGEGDFDYGAYLKAMQKFGYNGFITAEVSKMAQRRENYDPLMAAVLTHQTLSHAFKEVGL